MQITWNTDKQQYEMGNLLLVRCDCGTGGWSLHLPDDDGSNPLLSGPAELVDDEWNRPTAMDYMEAVGRIER